MEHGLKDIAFYVQKHITTGAVCHNILLVRESHLGASTSVRQVNCDSWLCIIQGTTMAGLWHNCERWLSIMQGTWQGSGTTVNAGSLSCKVHDRALAQLWTLALYHARYMTGLWHNCERWLSIMQGTWQGSGTTVNAGSLSCKVHDRALAQLWTLALYHARYMTGLWHNCERWLSIMQGTWHMLVIPSPCLSKVMPTPCS